MPLTFYETTRNKLRALKGSNLVSDIDEGFKALAEDVDTKMASYSQDTLAKRPAAGQPNRFFKATDTGALYHDTGAEWEFLMRGALSWGLVSATGTILAGTGDFTITKTGGGLYDLVWTKARLTNYSYAVVVTAAGGAGYSASYQPKSPEAGPGIGIHVRIDPGPADIAFSFVAIGP